MTRKRIPKKPNGFALVVTLSLMILLTVVAVGLLSLSAVSLRSAGQGDAMSRARSNARLALLLAIGELQKTAGPDQRITAPANLVNPSAAPGITGVWKSWRPPSENPNYSSAKSGANFLGYLVSDPDAGASPDPDRVPKASAATNPIVGSGSVGPGNRQSEVYAPVVEIAGKKNKAAGGFSWVVLDEGVKSRIDLSPAMPARSEGESITQVGSPERNGFEEVTDMEYLVASSDSDKDSLRDLLPKLISLGESDLAGGKKSAIQPYFHDFNVNSASVQADVANGGLKTDLSVLFDATSLPSTYASRRLYSNESEPLGGDRYAPDPLWSLLHGYSQFYKRTTANDNPMDGLKAYANRRYQLSEIRDASLRDNRIEPNMAYLKEPMIMPTIVRTDIVFTLVVRDVHGGRIQDLKSKGFPYMVHMMYLPVITLHNPYNVPLRFDELEVEFADLPMGFQFLVNNQAATTEMVGMNQLYVGNQDGSKQKVFKLTLTGDLSRTQEIVMGAGETRIFGKPFPANWKWDDEQAGFGQDGVNMFDWRNDKTGASPRIVPGMITGPNDGVGYDVDWLAPLPSLRPEWLKRRTGEGILPVKANELISVRYGPMTQASSSRSKKFSITMRIKDRRGGIDIATTQVFYKDDARLTSILEEGTSPRFQTAREFPETYPKRPIDAPKTARQLYESNSDPISEYAKARPFAIFSLSGKTTKEAFTRSRPVADTGAAFQMATCDFVNSESQGKSPMEFILTPVRGGSAVIDSNGLMGYFFGGYGTNNGTNAASFYEIPLAPLQSIAQLRHAQTANIGSMPYVTYSVGESRAHPALPADSAIHNPSADKVYFDHSWLANDQLWDAYWFSTLCSLEGKMYDGASSVDLDGLAEGFFDGSRTLSNSRNVAYLPPGKTVDDASSDVVDVEGRQSAAHMLTAGGFNVNSTSVEAWTSILSGLCDTDVPLASGTSEDLGSGAPFLRTRRPVQGRSGGGSSKEGLWNSYRSLEAKEIRELAEKVVVEVRERGPFLSMSEFVNRRLGSSDDLSNKGALQAAIDNTGFNGVMETNADRVGPGEVAGFDWANPDAVTGNTGAGSPGEISQGDILSSIGSFVTVRSDTFKIRASGDARDGNGNVVARAWCEATVQRLPDYLDSTDSPEIQPTTDANIMFGRQFKVVAFRWLNPSEI